jgi:hypothetical protein
MSLEKDAEESEKSEEPVENDEESEKSEQPVEDDKESEESEEAAYQVAKRRSSVY